MDEEDLSSISSRHYYPYQPHPPSTTGIDTAFPFEFMKEIRATVQKVMKEIKARMEKEADLDIGLEGFEFVKGFEECLRWFRVYFEALDESFPWMSNEHLMLEREARRAVVDLVAADCSPGKKPKKEHDVNKKETAFLAAAKNGIIEIVFELQKAIPSTIHETNYNNENVLLVAVKNRQTEVIEVLQKNLEKELFDSLIFDVDNMEITVLHLAPSKRERTWQIAGAMQMMWDIKWYKYIKDLVPYHFSFINNKKDETPREIFEQNHKGLMKESYEWIKETSNPCSVVAALIGSVCLATSSTAPGSTNKGKPKLEGQPAFDAFAIASLIGLSFSITTLTMFLAIPTSRKQVEDFRKSLSLKHFLA
ncbi:hypothetical protein JHK87_049510 [Glycine soja]|nr:hypothetical protein JHK87_049510 [Glycine soja]